jgi:hypothetical protein
MMRPRLSRSVALVGLLGALLTAAPAAANQTGLSTVSGHAYGESVDVTLLRVHTTSGPLPSTGELASNGSNSPLDNSALSVCVPSPGCATLSTGVLTVHSDGTTGATGSVHSTASVLNVNALNGLVTGAVVASQCAVDSNGATSGSSTLTTVVVNGVSVASNPGPNTALVLVDAGNLVVGSVILNEQIYDSPTNTLTVNAIHIHLTSGSLGSGDIIISQSQCDASPAGPAPVIPESSYALLLPLSGMLLAAGLLVLGRRRLALERS